MSKKSTNLKLPTNKHILKMDSNYNSGPADNSLFIYPINEIILDIELAEGISLFSFILVFLLYVA